MAPDEIRAFFQMSHIYNQVKDKQDMSLNPEFLEKYKELESKLKFVRRKTVSGINSGRAYKNNVILLGYDKFPLRENYSAPKDIELKKVEDKWLDI